MRHWGLLTVGVALAGCTVQVVNPVANVTAPVTAQAVIVEQVAAVSADPASVNPSPLEPFPSNAPTALPTSRTESAEQVRESPTIDPTPEPMAAPTSAPPMFEKVIFDNGIFQFRHHAALGFAANSWGTVSRSTSKNFPRASLYVRWSQSSAPLAQIVGDREVEFANANLPVLSSESILLDGIPAHRLILEGQEEIYAVRDGWRYGVNYSHPIDGADTPEHKAGARLVVDTWKWVGIPVAPSPTPTPTPAPTMTPRSPTPTPVFIQPSPER